jgi:hypothetical protein
MSTSLFFLAPPLSLDSENLYLSIGVLVACFELIEWPACYLELIRVLWIDKSFTYSWKLVSKIEIPESVQ